jgi:hypothetical protein
MKKIEYLKQINYFLCSVSHISNKWTVIRIYPNY